MEAMTVRERDTGKLVLHFTLDYIDEIPDEDPFYNPRVWGAANEFEAMEWLLGDTVVLLDDGSGEEATFDDGDLYTELLANTFHGSTLYSAELAASPEDVVGDLTPEPA